MFAGSFLLVVNNNIVVLEAAGGGFAGRTTADGTRFADGEMFVEEVAASGDLINGRLDGANIATERCGDKGTEKAHDASDDFVGGHFGGGPVELEETGVDIIIGSEEEIEGFETNKSKGEAEV